MRAHMGIDACVYMRTLTHMCMPAHLCWLRLLHDCVFMLSITMIIDVSMLCISSMPIDAIIQHRPWQDEASQG